MRNSFTLLRYLIFIGSEIILLAAFASAVFCLKEQLSLSQQQQEANKWNGF